MFKTAPPVGDSSDEEEAFASSSDEEDTKGWMELKSEEVEGLHEDDFLVERDDASGADDDGDSAPLPHKRRIVPNAVLANRLPESSKQATDVGTADAGTSDAGTADAGTADAGTADAGRTASAQMPPAPEVSLLGGYASSDEEEFAEPATQSPAGMTTIKARDLRNDNWEFDPQKQLQSQRQASRTRFDSVSRSRHQLQYLGAVAEEMGEAAREAARRRSKALRAARQQYGW